MSLCFRGGASGPIRAAPATGSDDISADQGSSDWGPGVWTIRSPGWQSSSRHRASRVEKRTARALPVLRIDRLARVTPTRSDSSVRDMRRSSSSRSSWIMIMARLSDRGQLFAAHGRPLTEDLGQDEDYQYAQPGSEVEVIVRGRLADGLGCDDGQHQGGQLNTQQAETHGLEPFDIGELEGVALVHRKQDAPQPVDDPPGEAAGEEAAQN